MKDFFRKEWVWAVGVVIVLSLLTYAPFIGELGLYQDDWYLVWSAEARGIDSIAPMFEIDRPFMGWLNAFDYQMMGMNVDAWHWYALFWRIMEGLGALWLLRLVWPKQPVTTTMMAVLVVVYPGFLSQPIGMNYKNYIFQYAVGLWSIGFTVAAYQAKSRAGRWGYSTLAILTMGYILIYEFMIGLEGMRLAILFYLYGRDNDWTMAKRVGRSLAAFGPYLAIAAYFSYWRIYIFDSKRVSTSEEALLAQFSGEEAGTVGRLAFTLFTDFVDTVFFSWTVPAYQRITGVGRESLGAGWWFALAAVALVGAYGWAASRHEIGEEDRAVGTAGTYLALGTFTVLTALATIVIPGRTIIFNGFERYGLHASLGAAMIVGAILLTMKPMARQIALLSLVLVSVLVHYVNAQSYSAVWASHMDTWRQLAWRAPDIEDDTLLLVRFGGFNSVNEDYEIWAPVNMMYAPYGDVPVIKSQVFIAEAVDLVRQGKVTGANVRDIKFNRDYGRALILTAPSEGACLHVIDGNMPWTTAADDDRVQLTAQYSNIDLILVDAEPVEPPEELFGPEPPHRWCYFYQKAMLARQQGDWEEVARLFDAAAAARQQPVDVREWLPFLEMAILTGDQEIVGWLGGVIRFNTHILKSVCDGLDTAEAFPPNYDAELIRATLCQE